MTFLAPGSDQLSWSLAMLNVWLKWVKMMKRNRSVLKSKNWCNSDPKWSGYIQSIAWIPVCNKSLWRNQQTIFRKCLRKPGLVCKVPMKVCDKCSPKRGNREDWQNEPNFLVNLILRGLVETRCSCTTSKGAMVGCNWACWHLDKNQLEPHPPQDVLSCENAELSWLWEQAEIYQMKVTLCICRYLL